MARYARLTAWPSTPHHHDGLAPCGPRHLAPPRHPRRRLPSTPDSNELLPAERPFRRPGPGSFARCSTPMPGSPWPHPRFPAVDVAGERRRHLVPCGLFLDWAATAAPSDNAAAAAAATAGHALRNLDRRAALNDLCARVYPWDAFRDFDDQDEDDAPHPHDCAGRCDGIGEVPTELTWEHHCDDGYTAVYQESNFCVGSPAPTPWTALPVWDTALPMRPDAAISASMGEVPTANQPGAATVAPQGHDPTASRAARTAGVGHPRAAPWTVISLPRPARGEKSPPARNGEISP